MELEWSCIAKRVKEAGIPERSQRKHCIVIWSWLQENNILSNVRVYNFILSSEPNSEPIPSCSMRRGRKREYQDANLGESLEEREVFRVKEEA